MPAAAAAGPVGLALLGIAAIGLTAVGIWVASQAADEEFEDKDADCVEEKCSASDTATQEPPIADQKQDGHVKGTPQHGNRVKSGKPTSTFDGDRVEADRLTQEAWKKGTPVPGRPGVRDYDFGRRIGTGPNGDGQSKVRVHQDGQGRIHGHPAGREQ